MLVDKKKKILEFVRENTLFSSKEIYAGITSEIGYSTVKRILSQLIFEKALLSLVLLSYIQAFGDGNKRTARIISNALLMANGYCPISFRTIDSVEYKKAILIFYEQNNMNAFKEIFINQFEFAVKTYF